MTLPALPLPDARPDPDSEGFYVTFQHRQFGACVAMIFDETGYRIDEIHEHSFRDAYDRVIAEYPQARWTPTDEEDEG